MSQCEKCIYHREFFDEVDGKIYHDGCVCDNEKVNLHYMYCGRDRGCPERKTEKEASDG